MTLDTTVRAALRNLNSKEFARMVDDTKTNNEWDVFAENHFLGRVTASNKGEAVKTGIRLFGSHLEGILRVQPRVQSTKDGWSRPI